MNFDQLGSVSTSSDPGAAKARLGTPAARRRLPYVLNRLRASFPTIAIFATTLAGWQLAVSWFDIKEYLLPSPLAVLRAMIGSDVPWTKHIIITAVEIFGAFVVAAGSGIILGIIVAWSATLERALMPFLAFVNSLPKVAIAPLFLLWLGYGIIPNILIGALIGFFPVVINTAAGLVQISPDLIDLGRVFNAPKWKIFVKIQVPNAAPYILSALKVTATSAVVGAVVGEFISSQQGLGYVIVTTQSSLDTPVAFAALFWMSAVGLLLFGAVGAASKLLAPWADDAK